MPNTSQPKLEQKRRVIGVDFDDVIFDLHGPFVDFVNKKKGTSVAHHEITAFNIEDVWQDVTSEEAQLLFHEFGESEEYNVCLPVEGALEHLIPLAEQNDVYVITARPGTTRERTESWFLRHFPNIVKAFHFTRQDRLTGVSRKKSEICKEIGVEIFIDDSMENAVDISSVGIPVLLLNAPWNQGELPPLVTRVNSWNEIINHLNS